MKKKILGLVGSYRKTGNSEIVVKEIAAKTGIPSDLELVRLPELSVRPCKGCYACLLPGIDCNLKDDVEWLKGKLLCADLCIVAAPDYVFGPVGIIKMIADRSLQFYDALESIGNIPAVAALTLGREDYRGYADAALMTALRTIGLECRGIGLFYGTHPGEVSDDPEFEMKARVLAAALTREAGPASWGSDRCGVCGSDLFRTRGSRVFCALCESEGVFNGGVFSITAASDKFEAEGKREHHRWLMGKKEEYLRTGERLKQVQDRYRGGTWSRPGE